SAVAGLCTRLSRAVDGEELAPILAEAMSILGASGLVLWIQTSDGLALAPAVVHGYSEEARWRMPLVPCGADTAITSAFRSASPFVVNGGSGSTGAIVVPVIGASGCTGVLALETKDDGDRREPVVSLATILAAQLATLISPLAAAPDGIHVPAQRAKRS